MGQTTATILAAMAGALIAIAGWFANYTLHQRSKRKDAQVEFLRKQYEEFYAPLCSLAQRSDHIYEVMIKRRNLVKDTEEYTQVTKYFADNYLRPIQSQIRNILENKNYLAVEPQNLPESYVKFLRFEAQSGIQYDIWSKSGIGGGIETEPYPKAFLSDLNRERDLIAERYRAYLRSHR
jgi:hypothetical protein